MNLSPEWESIFDNDYQVQHWTRVGLSDAPDTEILEWAKQHFAVILTNDLDFGTILAASHLDSPSVFQIRSQILDPRIVGRTVLACFKTFEPDLKAGALVSYEPDRSRVRKLPI